MLKTLLFIVIAGIFVYLLFKLCLYLYRPFFLSKTFREIEQMYNRLLTIAEKDVGSAAERLEKWLSGDKVITTMWTEDEIMERIKDAKAAKAHEEEVYGKFLRLRERYALNPLNPKKLSESIVAYRRYLEVNLKHRNYVTLIGNAITSGGMSFDEAAAPAKEMTIILEENERKLDTLLSE